MEQEKEIVEKFTQEMIKKISLRHNRYAPLGWKTMDMKRVISLLKGELNELEEALAEKDPEHAKEEAVDVANYCMFLWELNNQ